MQEVVFLLVFPPEGEHALGTRCCRTPRGSRYRLTERCLLALLQVNITLLDINDNYPTWKDEPYFINLVEMTPPNSDVTTVRAREGDCCAKNIFLSPDEVVTCLAGAGNHLRTGVTSSQAPSCRSPFKRLLLSLLAPAHPMRFSFLLVFFFFLPKLCGFWPNSPFLSLACDLLQGPL